jgi:hypothetical protein
MDVLSTSGNSILSFIAWPIRGLRKRNCRWPGLAAALMLAVAGFLTGRGFYATQESTGAQNAKERVREATDDDTLRSTVFDITRRIAWPAPFTLRTLRNAKIPAIDQSSSSLMIFPLGRT